MTEASRGDKNQWAEWRIAWEGSQQFGDKKRLRVVLPHAVRLSVCLLVSLNISTRPRWQPISVGEFLILRSACTHHPSHRLVSHFSGSEHPESRRSIIGPVDVITWEGRPGQFSSQGCLSGNVGRAILAFMQQEWMRSDKSLREGKKNKLKNRQSYCRCFHHLPKETKNDMISVPW